MVDAEVNAQAGIGAALDQLSGNQDQRIDVGHADEADADALAGSRIGLLIGGMQRDEGRLQDLGEVGTDILTTGTDDIEWQDLRMAAGRSFSQAGQTLLDKGVMRRPIAAYFAVFGGFGGELVEPGAADLNRSF